ncbi:energy-coupling factor ABC transporter ATP-binding protein [Methanosarcina sp.]|uniref:energy-coupling factor ABC transporter ATP-binding protein n=1 Tax=Methanosarcina sp. TaxID=2213 RepID=UPI0029899523|nr:ATP-binding cassette domain-containing protein [Methanosarcina sp.]MDW5551679.1 ATP-binding cassette domain-containing protein [Methanosarcina sp.]MDW5553182.1 ATP-binding cassette domain-containing protein [Methanosarcina sp.]MDW5558355.1 ATP-binding cassette domain-containing protein [Methanosarcina sp.]
MIILEARDLKYVYPDGTVAVQDLNLEIKKGKKVAFVGQNGSGKSTLFLLLNGTLKPAQGDVLFHGVPFKYDSKSLRDIRKSIGIVFQNSDDQIFAPTVYQDVAFGPANLGYSKERVDSCVQKALEQVGLSRLKDKPPHHLSGGQKKRVAIAGIMAMEPEVIILDEPLSNLDPVGADEIMDLLNEFNQFGSTIIISTHDVDLAYRWSDYVFLLTNSKIIGQGTPAEVFKEPELLKKAGLRQPTTLEIYHEIERRGLASGGNSPKTIPELVNTLKPIDLIWVDVPPGVKEGDNLNLGIMYGQYATHSPYEAVNATVLHVHPDGRAIVELKRKGIKAGGILIYDTDNYSLSELKQILKEGEIVFVGAMGKKSKTLAEQDGIRLDISSGVIDKSILTALCGKRCLILTAGGMVDHAFKRIKEYVETSGIEFTVGVVNRDEGCEWLEETGDSHETLKV